MEPTCAGQVAPTGASLGWRRGISPAPAALSCREMPFNLGGRSSFLRSCGGASLASQRRMARSPLCRTWQEAINPCGYGTCKRNCSARFVPAGTLGFVGAAPNGRYPGGFTGLPPNWEWSPTTARLLDREEASAPARAQRSQSVSQIHFNTRSCRLLYTAQCLRKHAYGCIERYAFKDNLFFPLGKHPYPKSAYGNSVSLILFCNFPALHGH